MDRSAIFVDAGYFFSAGASAIQGRQVPRKLISLRAAYKSLSALCDLAAEQTGMPLLRAYWYDAMPGSRPSLEQSTIAMLPRVKLRLGVLNNVGEQKGVDSLIVTDLIELARNRAIADAVIVSGDEDLRVAVQVAQSFGVRVHIMAAGDPKTNVSTTLQMEADSVFSLKTEWFAEHFLIAAAPAAPAVAATASVSAKPPPKSGVTLEEAARNVSGELLMMATAPQISELKAHFTTSSMIPPDFDRRLIARTAAELGGRLLSGDEMRQVRGVFVTKVRAV